MYRSQHGEKRHRLPEGGVSRPVCGLYICPPNFTGKALFEQQFNKRTVVPPDIAALRGNEEFPVVPVTMHVYGHEYMFHLPLLVGVSLNFIFFGICAKKC